MVYAGIIASLYLLTAFKVRDVACIRLGFEQPGWNERAVVFVAAVIVYIVVHESGHRVAGALQGWRCVQVGFGPIGFAREGRRWRVRLAPFVPGAFVRHVPARFAGYRRQKAITVLSGPLASLGFGAVCARLAVGASGAMEFWIPATFAVL